MFVVVTSRPAMPLTEKRIRTATLLSNSGAETCLDISELIFTNVNGSLYCKLCPSCLVTHCYQSPRVVRSFSNNLAAFDITVVSSHCCLISCHCSPVLGRDLWPCDIGVLLRSYHEFMRHNQTCFYRFARVDTDQWAGLDCYNSSSIGQYRTA